MTMLLVSHDVAVVAETCDEVAVMYAGIIVERAPTRQIFEAPKHPYTAGLLGSIPHGAHGRARLQPIAGQPPDLTRLPPGCPFFERCRYRTPDCAVTPVALYDLGPNHATACLYPERLAAAAA
jgi:oligopeptide/dipeptide ABC transporter ATP-binding protein